MGWSEIEIITLAYVVFVFTVFCISLIGRATAKGGEKANLFFTCLLNDLWVVHVSNVVKY